MYCMSEVWVLHFCERFMRGKDSVTTMVSFRTARQKQTTYTPKVL